MNDLVRKLVFLSPFLVGCTSFAFADTVNVNGNVSFDSSSLTFAPPFTTGSNTGVFSNFSTGTVTYLLGTVDYMGGVSAPEEAFYITANNGDVLAFWDMRNNAMQSLNASGDLTVSMDELGFYTLNGGPAMAGDFHLDFTGSTPGGSQDYVPFYGSGSLVNAVGTAVTPEPSSFLLLGTGFLGAAALLRRRQQSS